MRQRLTDEQRLLAIPPDLRVQLLVASELVARTRARLEVDQSQLRTAIEQALEFGSLGDVAAVLGMPRSSVHFLVKPPRR